MEKKKKKELAFWLSSLAFRREWIASEREKESEVVYCYLLELYCTYKFKDKV